MHQLQLNPSISTKTALSEKNVHAFCLFSFDEAMKSAFTDKNQTARLKSTPPELNIYTSQKSKYFFVLGHRLSNITCVLWIPGLATTNTN